jgi:hypothetical protein
MFCPKCGVKNPDNGKFCRTCGTDLAGVSRSLSGVPPATAAPMLDRKGKPMNWEGAMTKLFMGLAFLTISIILGISGMAGGRGWWYWMLIPAFMFIGSGIARIMQLKQNEKAGAGIVTVAANDQIPSAPNNHALPPPQTEWVAPESRYKTGDLVPPSVTDATTRHLKPDSEGQTMTLPKK